MISVIVSAIRGLISPIVSGWLGGSGMWNVVKVALELGSNSSKHARQQCSLGAARHAMDGVFGHYSFFIDREWFVE